MKHQPGSAQPSLFDFLMDDPFSESANRPKPKPEPVTAKSEDPPHPKSKPRAVPAPVPKPAPPPEAKVVQPKPAKAPNKRKKTPPVILQPEPLSAPIPQKQNSKLMAVPEPKPPAIEPHPQPPVLGPSATSLPRKACPFCKREVLSLAKTTRPAQGMAVECLKCGFRGSVGVNEAEAVAKWNTDNLRNKGARLVQTLERSKKRAKE